MFQVPLLPAAGEAPGVPQDTPTQLKGEEPGEVEEDVVHESNEWGKFVSSYCTCTKSLYLVDDMNAIDGGSDDISSVADGWLKWWFRWCKWCCGY